MAMNDRAVLRGGPSNDACFLIDNVAEVLVIRVEIGDVVHLYALNMELASASIYDYVGIEIDTSPPDDDTRPNLYGSDY